MIKQLMPKTLLARAVLIVVLPTVLVQLVTAFIFYDRHWESVTRHMANSLAGEIAFISYQAGRMEPEAREALTWIFGETTGIQVTFKPGAQIAQSMPGNDFPEFRESLQTRTDLPFSIMRLSDGETVRIDMQIRDGVLSFDTTLKRLESGTTVIFLLWMAGSSLVFLCIALLFSRNQVRPIRQLAEAAENFGKGQDMPGFKPYGALEVRRAARAFLIMRDRIARQIRSRTEMLAGISHDLRTPLTRMKLQLALPQDAQSGTSLSEDVEQMERMIAEYLDFARGDSGEESNVMRISELLKDIAGDYRRQGKNVQLDIQDATLALREGAIRRLMHNLIDNAFRYGRECSISTVVSANRVEINVDDKGPGIPESQREEVFRPFTRLDASRNPATGGVGLGLTIARDVARSHGGDISLGEAPGGGLRVVVRLPL